MVLTLWVGPARGFRPVVTLVDSTGQRLTERDNPARRPLDLAADELLVVRHEVATPARATAGEYRLEADAAGWGVAAGPVELGVIPGPR